MSTNSSNLLPVSVLIVTHRADHRFETCLRSVQFADEILIVDANSQNNWASLTKDYRFNVVKSIPQVTHFSETRNWLISQAKHDWIFFIDSDEQVSPKLATQLPELIKSKTTAGYVIHRLDFFHGKALHFGDVGKVYKLRLAQKKRLKYHRPVHEQAQVVGITKRVEAPIWHYSHESLAEFWSKISLYASMEAEYRYQQGIRFQLWQLLVLPAGKLCYLLGWKLGFLDGTRGLIYAVMMSCHSAIVRIKLYELGKTSS